MKVIKIILLHIFLLSFLSSCETTRMKKLILGLWGIEKLSINNNDVLNKYKTNIIYFKSKNYCELPIQLRESKANDEGNWRIEKERSRFYIIFDSPNNLFNGKFLIQSIQKVRRGNGYLFQMRLKKENIMVVCYKS